MKNMDFREIWTGVAHKTPLGSIWIAVCNQGLLAVHIGESQGDFTQMLTDRFDVPVTPTKLQTEPVIQQIETYLQGARKTFEVSILWDAMSDFQQKVLQAVYAIPYGETRTYGQIAAQIGSPRAARAVGRANATNPIPLVIPCHRVIAADGNLRGYGAGEGIRTKAWLLDLEKSGTSLLG